MKEFFASPPRERPSELDQARMRKARNAVSAGTRPVRPADSSDVVSEMRAMRNEMLSEMASLREMLIEQGPAPANDEILTRKQTAELLGVCVESITRLVREEGLPCTKLVKDYRFLRSQVLAWFAARGCARSSGED